MNPNNNNQNNNTDNSNNNANNTTRTITGADVPLTLKARYFGSGVAVGVLIGPALKNLVERAVGTLPTNVSGKGADILSQAKDILRNTGLFDSEEAAENVTPIKKKDECCDEDGGHA